MSSLKNPILIGGLGLGILILATVAYILRPTVAPSGELEAVPIDLSTQVSTEAVTESLAEATLTELSSSEETTEGASASLGGIYEIQQNGSSARFTLSEVLRGSPTTVIGRTNQVAGQILIDAENPAGSQLGLIQVNARTLQTDNESRNRAIRNEILDVAAFEFVEFETTALQGLPAVIVVGEAYAFEIVGNLIVRDISQEVRFSATLTFDSETSISGSASTTITRSAYNLTIPNVPSVANVSEEVLLEINFVALAQ